MGASEDIKNQSFKSLHIVVLAVNKTKDFFFQKSSNKFHEKNLKGGS